MIGDYWPWPCPFPSRWFAASDEAPPVALLAEVRQLCSEGNWVVDLMGRQIEVSTPLQLGSRIVLRNGRISYSESPALARLPGAQWIVMESLVIDMSHSLREKQAALLALGVELDVSALAPGFWITNEEQGEKMERARGKIADLMPRAMSRAIVLEGLGNWLRVRSDAELRLSVKDNPESGIDEFWATVVIAGGSEFSVWERMLEPTSPFLAIEKACQLYEKKFDPVASAEGEPAQVEPLAPDGQPKEGVYKQTTHSDGTIVHDPPEQQQPAPAPELPEGLPEEP